MSASLTQIRELVTGAADFVAPLVHRLPLAQWPALTLEVLFHRATVLGPEATALFREEGLGPGEGCGGGPLAGHRSSAGLTGGLWLNQTSEGGYTTLPNPLFVFWLRRGCRPLPGGLSP